MHHIFFIHSSVNGHLGCFHVCNQHWGTCVLSNGFSRDICPVMGFLGHIVVLFLVFKETSYCSPQWMYQFTFPPTVQEFPFSPHPLQHLLFIDYFDDGHSDWYEVITHYSFDLRFSNNCDIEHLFMCLLAICMSSVERCLFRSSTHFLIGLFAFLILCSMHCLYIFLEINPLSLASLVNIFSHSEGCLFVLFMVSFAVQKLLSLIRSCLFMFVFIFITLGGGSKNILLWFMSKTVFPMFSSKGFIVSGLTFWSLIHFEFIFVYSVR